MGWDDASASLQDTHEDSDYRRVDVITARRKRRSWPPAEKARIVAEGAKPASSPTRWRTGRD